jgi:hypothetical protein
MKAEKPLTVLTNDRPTESIVKLVKVDWRVLSSAVAAGKEIRSSLRKNVGLGVFTVSWIALIFLMSIL